jgi:hypothetical protein
LEYVKRKINGRDSVAGESARNAVESVHSAVRAAVRSLSARDFEILVDLITREAGWRRLDELGGKQKGVDLVVREPLTERTMIVSVKSAARRSDLDVHLESLRDSYPNAHHRVLAIHHPPKDFQVPARWTLWNDDVIASKAVQLGLADWVVDRAL